jgi:hypothetical protein
VGEARLQDLDVLTPLVFRPSHSAERNPILRCSRFSNSLETLTKLAVSSILPYGLSLPPAS